MMTRMRRILLYPFSLLYGLVIDVRNYLYDKGFFLSAQFPVPVVCIGNITVGGTGKTPHVEYFIRWLTGSCRPGLISRGYRRKSKGTVIATGAEGPDQLGDEPFQVFSKFPKIRLVIDGHRRRGINQLLRQWPDTTVVLMDDGFQHRSVRPTISIVLIDYNRLPWEDCLLPAGNLREHPVALNRAWSVLVTKTPYQINKEEQAKIRISIARYTKAPVYFTTFRYGLPEPLFGGGETSKTVYSPGLAFSGLAYPQPFVNHLEQCYNGIRHVEYADHYVYTVHDMERMGRLTDGKILTTEKDAVKVKQLELPDELKCRLYFVPIEVEFLDEEDIFREQFSQLFSLDCFE